MSKKPNRVVQYKIANEKFLEQKAQEEGIKVLESGILIREIEKGSGTRMPQLRSTVGLKNLVFIIAEFSLTVNSTIGCKVIHFS